MTLPQRQGIRVQRDHDQFRKILAGGSITADNKWGAGSVEVRDFLCKYLPRASGAGNTDRLCIQSWDQYRSKSAGT